MAGCALREDSQGNFGRLGQNCPVARWTPPGPRLGAQAVELGELNVTTHDIPAVQGHTLFGQATRFIAVGLMAAVVDLGVYQLGLHLGLWIHLARAASFTCGTTTAYVLNRRWAFQASGGPQQSTHFALLYGSTFFLILGINSLALSVLPAAAWNNLGMVDIPRLRDDLEFSDAAYCSFPSLMMAGKTGGVTR
jgi:putative flippase GtrA